MHFYYLIFLLNVGGIFGLGLLNFNHGYEYLTELRDDEGHNHNASKLDDVKKKWIEQRLDHFDPEETRTWKMKYYEDLEFWKPNGPIYIVIGGEAPVAVAFRDSYVQQLQKETNGSVFYSEHRYYGQSMPLDNQVTKNFKYLSSQQALADLAQLIETIKSYPMFKTSTDSKVVVIGGSYSGNLAIWMRLKYPTLVDAAVASSAPVLAKVDFSEYLEKVSDVYQQLGPQGCHDKIAEIFKRYDQLFKSDEGIKQLKVEENICDDNDMTKLENKQFFFVQKLYPFAFKAQYGIKDDILEHCHQMMDFSVLNLKMLFEDKTKILRQERGCFDCDFNKYINDTIRGDVTSWFYQECTEFGYFQTTNSAKQPFTNNVPANFYFDVCKKLFGPKFNEKRVKNGVKYTNKFYGGLSPNVTKVVFVNGDLDPWNRLGILSDLSSDAPAIVIPNTNHCTDLRPIRYGDADELVDARNRIKNLVKKWIGFDD